MALKKRGGRQSLLGRPLKKKKIKLKRKLLAALDLPEETEPAVQKLTMLGREDLLIENHMGVQQCDRKEIRIITHEGIVCIQGEELVLLQVAQTRAYIRGGIRSIGFLE